MSMAVIAGVATVAGAGYTAYSTSQNSSANQAQLANQSDIVQSQYDQSMALSDEYLSFLKDALSSFTDNSYGIVEGSYSNVNNIISKLGTDLTSIIDAIPGVGDLMGEAKTLSLDDFNFRDAIQKSNLAFIEGGTDPQIREAQQLNASLAALDSSAFEGKMGDILKSNIYGLKAVTAGEPSGTFSNLSAQNLYSFSQQGLSNYLAISDFFSREGTVDPISPLQTAFDLQKVEQGISSLRLDATQNVAQLGIQNEQWKGQAELGIESTALGENNSIAQMGLSTGLSALNAYSSGQIGVSNGYIANNAATTAGYTQAASQLISGLTSYGATSNMQQSSQVQQDYLKALTSRLSTSTGGY